MGILKSPWVSMLSHGQITGELKGTHDLGNVQITAFHCHYSYIHILIFHDIAIRYPKFSFIFLHFPPCFQPPSEKKRRKPSCPWRSPGSCWPLAPSPWRSCAALGLPPHRELVILPKSYEKNIAIPIVMTTNNCWDHMNNKYRDKNNNQCYPNSYW